MKKYKLLEYIPNKVFADILFEVEPSGCLIKSDELRLNIQIDKPTFIYERALISAFDKSHSYNILFSVQEFDYLCYEDGMIWFEDNVNEVAFFEDKISLEFIIAKLKTYGYIQKDASDYYNMEG